jgi:DNA-binding beta-propeller fold protein YncE
MQGRRATLGWLAACALLGSCAEVPVGQPKNDEGDRLWPMPPELPRFAYETSLRSAADVMLDTEEEKLRRRVTGALLPDNRLLEKPAAVAARRGRVYVTDAVRRSIVVFDAPRRRVFQFGLRAPGTLGKPTAIAIDAAGRVYVADATLRKVVVYDGLGLFQQTIGDPGQLQRPTGVAVNADGSRIYVIDRSDNDSDRHRVVAYAADGKLLREIGQRGRRDGEFNVPVQGAVSPDGRLHVLDAGNFRVQTFDADGAFISSFGNVGTGLGQLARPRALACDGEGRLYVTDTAFGNVQVFTPRGELLMSLGRGDKRDLPGRYGLLMGVAIDETGRLYLVDQLFGKVEVMRALTEAEGRRLQAAA